MKALLVCLAVALVGCGDDSRSDGGGGSGPAGGADASGGGGSGEGGGINTEQSVPTYFRMTATADGRTEEDINVSCFLDFIFELEAETERTEELVEIPGFHGGEARRSLLDDKGAGFVFSASAAGDVVATLRFPDELDLAIPINDTAENRFWKEMRLFQGTLAEDGTASGAWTCAPLDIEQEGYVDNEVVLEGTWSIEPITE